MNQIDKEKLEKRRDFENQFKSRHDNYKKVSMHDSNVQFYNVIARFYENIDRSFPNEHTLPMVYLFFNKEDFDEMIFKLNENGDFRLVEICNMDDYYSLGTTDHWRDVMVIKYNDNIINDTRLYETLRYCLKDGIKWKGCPTNAIILCETTDRLDDFCRWGMQFCRNEE